MSNPIITITPKLTAVKLDIKLYDQITFVSGDSGIGKTFLFKQLQLIATKEEFKYIKCLNYLTADLKDRITEYAQNPNNLVVLDNGDVLMDADTRSSIIEGKANFLIFSREYYGLAFSKYNVADLQFTDRELSLRFPLAEVL